MLPACCTRSFLAIDSNGLDGWGRWLAPALTLGAGLTVALLLLLLGQALLAAVAAAAGAAGAAVAFVKASGVPSPDQPLAMGPDYSILGSALGLSLDPTALTTSEGSVLIVNAAYRERFGEIPAALAGHRRRGAPGSRACADDGVARWRRLRRRHRDRRWNDPVEVERVGAHGEHLLWRFPQAPMPDPLTSAVKRVHGLAGESFGKARVMAAVVDENGRVMAANRLFLDRASVPEQIIPGARFTDLVEIGEDDQVRLFADGEGARSLRAVHVPADPSGESAAGTFLLFEDDTAASLAQSSNLQALLDVLPVGLALVDRDGRFLTMNQAFRQAAGLKGTTMPIYPGDLVVKEDKAAVADAVRRNARGPAMTGDLAVRLVRQPAEPVALTIAGLRGIGDAPVLLLLKDNSEEAKLKRQVAQATKMQVVGQLAGGVAHDFNNILTAIIGHCDLMLMRHTPGDSDYDDIQQIKSNSNRAAGLTRQLLAFSRQQTLRPQVLQLPDVVSEVSHLLKRLLGETVELVVKHGRSLGPVRADPGQLEQVIVNLAVNARDAMAEKGGGALTIQTYSVKANQVAELGSDILPIADYSALSVTDTGVGIAPSILGKVFEPFFTTKEIGKGTGLGLSTVYGIVKQSGGFIFADFEGRRGHAVRDLSSRPSRGSAGVALAQGRKNQEG